MGLCQILIYDLKQSGGVYLVLRITPWMRFNNNFLVCTKLLFGSFLLESPDPVVIHDACEQAHRHSCLFLYNVLENFKVLKICVFMMVIFGYK